MQGKKYTEAFGLETDKRSIPLARRSPSCLLATSSNCGGSAWTETAGASAKTVIELRLLMTWLAYADRLGASCRRECGAAAGIGDPSRKSQRDKDSITTSTVFQGGSDVIPRSVRRHRMRGLLYPRPCRARARLAQPLHVVSTVSAGNAGDIMARIVLEQLSKQIHQSFFIENRTGAGGAIGSVSVAKARSGRVHNSAAVILAEFFRRSA